jgi:hypothetical protein
VVGTIIVVQVSDKLYGKFRSCDKQYLLFVVLCYEPGLPKFSGFVFVLLFLVVFCYRLSWLFFFLVFVAIGACIPLLYLAIIEDAQSLDSLSFV